MIDPYEAFGKPPTNLGGYQAIVEGVIEYGDLIVSGCHPDQSIYWAHGLIGANVRGLVSTRCYRKLPVAKQGDIDHGQEVQPALRSKLPKCEDQSYLSPMITGLTPPVARPIAATHDDGKPPLAFLPTAGIRAVAQVQAYGHKKYHDFHNFRKGIQHSRAISCALRHLAAHMDGETVDPESGELHLAHAATRILFLIQNINDGTAIDDRFKKE